MAKGYWIARVDVADPEGYKEYQQLNAAAFKKYGARFLVRGGAFVSLAGTPRARNVVIEFDSVEQARACYESPEYQLAAKARDKYAAAVDVIIVEGYDGPQPNG